MYYGKFEISHDNKFSKWAEFLVTSSKISTCSIQNFVLTNFQTFHSRKRVRFPLLLLLLPPVMNLEVYENWQKTSHPTCNIDECAQAKTLSLLSYSIWLVLKITLMIINCWNINHQSHLGWFFRIKNHQVLDSFNHWCFSTWLSSMWPSMPIILSNWTSSIWPWISQTLLSTLLKKASLLPT